MSGKILDSVEIGGLEHALRRIEQAVEFLGELEAEIREAGRHDQASSIAFFSDAISHHVGDARSILSKGM